MCSRTVGGHASAAVGVAELATMFETTNPAEMTRRITTAQTRLIALMKKKTKAVVTDVTTAYIVILNPLILSNPGVSSIFGHSPIRHLPFTLAVYGQGVPKRTTKQVNRKHLSIAAKITADIETERFAIGDALPSESALAARFGVARGTVRRALRHIEHTSHQLSRRGSRWIVHAATLVQDVTQLRSFGQWATAIGHQPGGQTLLSSEGRATAEEAHALAISVQRPVFRITRLQSIDELPVMVKRTTFPEWLIPTISRLPQDASSIMDVVERVHGPQLAYGEHLITAVLPNPEDARLLGISRTTPLLRVQRSVRTFDGRPFEYSDDRYLATSTSLSIVNSARSSLAR